jgi:hypothetical protein
MKPRSKRFEREEQIALLKDCIASNLSIREYAVFKNIGFSTINGWASQQGISLTKEKKKLLSDDSAKTNSADEAPNTATDLKDKGMEDFSFINLTDHIKDIPPFLSSSIPHQTSQELHCPKDSPLCGLEICMPSGVMLKVGQVPFSALWPQVVEFVRALDTNADVA